MIQQIEKLKREREKLVVEYKNNQTEYKSEIKRIDKAIRTFEKGVNQLGVNSPHKSRVKTIEVIEKILAGGPRHLKEIIAQLNSMNFGKSFEYQSVSGMLQLYVKAGKKIMKTAPATFALVKSTAQIENEKPVEQIVFYEEECNVNEGGADA